ncbi:MAG TPA: hypothetical protein VFR01_08955 [Geobacterales bacterium]|nr:hypothetical protein [Geobacterales bacterium]
MHNPMRLLLLFTAFILVVFHSVSANADETGGGTIVTIWPLVDYRQSPREGYSNLSLLGPLIKVQKEGGDRESALRPLFYTTSHADGARDTDYLYPLASTHRSASSHRLSILQLFQVNLYRQGEEREDQSTTLFPIYFHGSSERYGPYTAIFPLYGDLYDRFGRDEIHFALFPLYSRTVKRGTTNRNYLWPFFAQTSGERESGFQFWPLYGQGEKEGVYRSRFVLWPFYLSSNSQLNTDQPMRKLTLFPLYAATDTQTLEERHYLWPFFGYTNDSSRHLQERDYLWPFWFTVRGDDIRVTSILPLYKNSKNKEFQKQWYLWPVVKIEAIDSPSYRQERFRILLWLYTDEKELWPDDGGERQRVALWPLFLYRRDSRGVRNFTLPALVEPILDRPGIEKSWAPLWRIYAQRWNDRGESALSLVWNLYWHERRPHALAFELFPLVSGHAEATRGGFRLIKGVIGYDRRQEEKRLILFWLPVIRWGEQQSSAISSSTGDNGAHD